MIVLFIVVVLAGCMTPFFLEHDAKMKEKFFNYGIVTLDMALLYVMVKSKLAGMPGYGDTETITIGFGIITVAIFIAKLYRTINSGKQARKPAKSKKVAN